MYNAFGESGHQMLALQESLALRLGNLDDAAITPSANFFINGFGIFASRVNGLTDPATFSDSTPIQ